MKRFINAIGNALLTVLVMLLIGYTIAFIEIKLMLKPNVELFGYILYLQPDSKMEDRFSKNDVILVKKNAQFEPGEMILYTDNGKYYVRTVESTNDLATMVKCESCLSESKEIKNNKIQGKAVAKVILIGSIIVLFKNKILLTVLGLVGFICLIISHYLKVKPDKIRREEVPLE